MLFFILLLLRYSKKYDYQLLSGKKLKPLFNFIYLRRSFRFIMLLIGKL